MTDQPLRIGVLFGINFHDGVSGGEKITAYNKGRMTFQGDRGRLTADWERIMSSEAEQVGLEQDGVRRKIEPEFETLDPAAAFIATVLDSAPNPCPAHEAALHFNQRDKPFEQTVTAMILSVLVEL